VQKSTHLPERTGYPNKTHCLAVLVLAGRESMFFPAAAVVWIYYQQNVDNTLMFPVVAKK